MDKHNLYPPDQYPPTNSLAAAIKKLPKAGPGVPRQEVEVDAGSTCARYRVTFVVRQNAELGTPAWFWGVESSVRLSGDPSGPGEHS